MSRGGNMRRDAFSSVSHSRLFKSLRFIRHTLVLSVQNTFPAFFSRVSRRLEYPVALVTVFLRLLRVPRRTTVLTVLLFTGGIFFLSILTDESLRAGAVGRTGVDHTRSFGSLFWRRVLRLDSPNLPPLHYESDPHGAIDVYRSSAETLCRVYRVCVRPSGTLMLPEWMKNFTETLSDTCGIPHDQMEFVDVEQMGRGLPGPPKVDWLGMGLPPSALGKFFGKPLRSFYPNMNAPKNLLYASWSIRRQCVAPGKSNICGNSPEGFLAKPSVLVNMPADKEKLNKYVESAIRREFETIHGSSLRILNAAVFYAWADKLCFRSVVLSRDVDKNAENTSTGSSADERKAESRQENLESIPAQNNLDTAGSSRDLGETSKNKDRARGLVGEGGVEFLFHSSLGDYRQADGAVCRFYRVCLRSDGTLVLPDWLETHRDELQRCGLGPKGIAFVKSDDFSAAFEAEREWNRGIKYSDANDDGTDTLDLLGTKVVRPQSQHFMTDFFPSLHALDALYRNRTDPGYKHVCLYRSGAAVGTELTVDQKCELDNEPSFPLRPAVVVPDKLKLRSSSRFIKDFLRLLPPKGDGPRPLYSGTLYQDPDEAMCFRSLVVAHPKIRLESVLPGHNILFSNNGLSQEDIRDIYLNGKDGSRGQCEVSVTVLQPRRLHVNYSDDSGSMFIWPTSIANGEELGAAISRRVESSLLSRQIRNFAVSVENLEFEGTGISKVLRRMQETDILIAPHDPSLTSLVFLRPGSTVVEVQPFAYYAGPYNQFGRMLNLDYTRFAAIPDKKSFKACLEAHEHDDWPAGISPEVMREKMQGVLELYERAAKDFNESGYSEGLRLERSQGQNRPQVPFERTCAKGQRLFVEATRVAALVVERAGRRCKSNVRDWSTRSRRSEIF